jgi:signal transduction histidine kinase
VILDPLLDGAPCGFVQLADDGTMLAVNQTLADLLRYTRVDLVGWHVQKILPPGARVFYNTHVFPLLKMHGVADEIYMPLRTSAGEDVPMLFNARRRPEGDAEVNDCVFVRMIQRHQYEEQLLIARREAERASASKSRFLSMMSHDLRTPLTAISGYAELILNDAVESSQKESALAIREAARSVARMIDDILAFAQLESAKIPVNAVEVDLGQAVARAESLIRGKMQQSALTFSIEGGRGIIALADPDRLQQILLNLLTNAAKFTAPGGRVTISCESSGDRVLIRVSDDGIGVPEEQLEHIFEPFVQLNQGTHLEGVGLGLAISRELARAMGGELTATSTPAKGSVFTLEIAAATSGEKVSGQQARSPTTR